MRIKETSHPANSILTLYFFFFTCSTSGKLSHLRGEAIPPSENAKIPTSPLTLVEEFAVYNLFVCIYMTEKKKNKNPQRHSYLHKQRGKREIITHREIVVLK